MTRRGGRWPLALALAMLALGGGSAKPLPPQPEYLVYKSFVATHPQGCSSRNPLWTSWQYHLNGKEKFGAEGCRPYNQLVPTKGALDMATFQRFSPNPLLDLSLRLWRPDRRFVKGIKPLPKCNIPTLMDPGLEYGPVGCRSPLFQFALTKETCAATGGTVAAVDGGRRPTRKSPNIQCDFVDDVPYDLSTAPGAGTMMFQALLNFHKYGDDYLLDTSRDPLDFKPASKKLAIQLLGTVPLGVQQSAARPCSERKYCRWDSSDQTTLELMAWNDGTQFTVVAINPVFVIPIGGVWRVQLKASRIVEPMTRTSNPGYPVKSYLITWDDDLLKDDSGTVIKRGSGFLYKKGLVAQKLDLKGMSPGFHRFSIKADTYDSGTEAASKRKGTKGYTQSAVLSTYIEVVPPCPRNAKVPFATFVDSASWGTYDVRGGKRVEKGDYALNLQRSWTRGVPTTAYLSFTFDLSFLSSRVKLAGATLYIHVSSAYEETAKSPLSFTLNAYDGSKRSAAGGPCAPPACTGATKLGSTSFKGTQFKGKDDSNQWLKIPLDAAKLDPGGTAVIAVVMPSVRDDKIDGLRLRGYTTGSAPFLILKGAC